MSEVNSRKNSTLITLGVGLLFVIIILVQFFSTGPANAYYQEIESQRETKDYQFSSSPQSPIPKAERASFDKLDYFPIDRAYAVPATLVKDSLKDTLSLTTSLGNAYRTVRIGKLNFNLLGKDYSLIAYQYLELDKRNKLFILFRDLTTNVSTYGGGRYIDIPYTQELEIDFNQAYNPYCVYNETFECPFPPRENYIPLEIQAGEKMYGTPAHEL
ncbi:MAG: DUF1684 domain-containing protein [Bacteroidota bacterium]